MENGQIHPFRPQSSSQVYYGSLPISLASDYVILMIIFLPVTAFILVFISQFLKLNVKKSWGVLNPGVVFFAIVSRLLRRCTTTDGGHGSNERDFSFSLFPQQVAVEMVDKEEEVKVVVVNRNEDVEKKENVQVEVVEKEVNERHRSKKKECHHHYHVHLYHHHYYHVRHNHRCRHRHRLVDQQQLSADTLSNLSSFANTAVKVVGTRNELRRINSESPDPRQESFTAPEDRTFDYQYAEQSYHRPDPSAPPLPKSYDTQHKPIPKTIRRVDASSLRPRENSSAEPLPLRTEPRQRPPPLQQTELQPLKSKKIPLPPPPPPLPPPRRRKEREERRIIIRSKKYKKEESEISPFQTVISLKAPSSQPKQPPPTKIEPSLPPSQSSIDQSLFQIQHPPPPPAPSASFLQKLLKLNNNKKKVNLKAAPPPPPPPASSVLQHIFKKSSKTKKTLSDSSLPPLPSWDSHQNPAPEAAKLMKRSTGKPPLPPQTKMLIKKRRNTNSHPKREIYWNIDSQSPLDGIPPPPPPPPFPTRGMKFVARGDLVKIQSSSSDFPDDPPSTPCYSSSDVNIKAKNFIDTTRAGFQQVAKHT